MNKDFIYRFRPRANLLDGYNELGSQSVYFAEPEELNDPVEGYIDCFWRGDAVLWTNFFKNYIYSLSECWLDLLKSNNSDSEFKYEIHIRFDRNITEGGLVDLIKSVSSEFFKEPVVINIINMLANQEDKIRRSEVLFYLEVLHRFALGLFYEQAEKNEIIYHKNGGSYIGFKNDLVVNKLFTANFLGQINADITEHIRLYSVEREEAFLNVVESVYKSMNYSINTVKPEDENFLNHEFPSVYIDRIDQLLFPKWYVACFSSSYKNSSMWGQYSDSHRGICLEYNVILGKYLELTSLSEGDDKPYLPIHEVKYSGYKEVDFFRNLMGGESFHEFWHMDENGLKSELWDNDLDNEAWTNHYYQKVCCKSSDWKHEEEYRVIISSYQSIGKYQNSDSRILQYPITSLSGVIFGIKTLESDKKRIIEFYRNTFNGDEKLKISFYQAYYSHADQAIKRYKL